jgi:hypothetical protein
MCLLADWLMDMNMQIQQIVLHIKPMSTYWFLLCIDNQNTTHGRGYLWNYHTRDYEKKLQIPFWVQRHVSVL